MDKILETAQIIKNSNNIVAFTGAGVSTESNIPDFRSSGGLYEKKKNKYPYPPEVMLSHSFFAHHTKMFFDFYRDKMVYKDAKPNRCHTALEELERMDKLKAIITQNIDGLHEMAGSKNILNLHGTIYSNHCTKCGKQFNLEYVLNCDGIPYCGKCKGIVKPDVVLYEESLDYNVLNSSVSSISKCDVLIVLGTSLVVYPAAGLINYYKGNNLIIINKSSTPYDNKARIVINDKAGDVMGKVLTKVTAM